MVNKGFTVVGWALEATWSELNGSIQGSWLIRVRVQDPGVPGVSLCRVVFMSQPEWVVVCLAEDGVLELIIGQIPCFLIVTQQR